jgi:hypothetical protein
MTKKEAHNIKVGDLLYASSFNALQERFWEGRIFEVVEITPFVWRVQGPNGGKATEKLGTLCRTFDLYNKSVCSYILLGEQI